jgi:hypothetical protein
MCELLHTSAVVQKMMGAQGVQKTMGYSKSNLVTEVTAAETKARQVVGRQMPKWAGPLLRGACPGHSCASPRAAMHREKKPRACRGFQCYL